MSSTTIGAGPHTQVAKLPAWCSNLVVVTSSWCIWMPQWQAQLWCGYDKTPGELCGFGTLVLTMVTVCWCGSEIVIIAAILFGFATIEMSPYGSVCCRHSQCAFGYEQDSKSVTNAKNYEDDDDEDLGVQCNHVALDILWAILTRRCWSFSQIHQVLVHVWYIFLLSHEVVLLRKNSSLRPWICWWSMPSCWVHCWWGSVLGGLSFAWSQGWEPIYIIDQVTGIH